MALRVGNESRSAAGVTSPNPDGPSASTGGSNSGGRGMGCWHWIFLCILVWLFVESLTLSRGQWVQSAVVAALGLLVLFYFLHLLLSVLLLILAAILLLWLASWSGTTTRAG